MVDSMYWVLDLVMAAAILINYVKSSLSAKGLGKSEEVFRGLGKWLIFFFIQDAIWGIAASDMIRNDTVLMISSTVFHLSSSIILYLWIRYVLTYMEDEVQNPNLYIRLGAAAVVFEAILLTVNFFQPTIFYIGENGEYCTGPLRFTSFIVQYIMFMTVGLAAGINALRKHGELRQRYKVIAVMSLCPMFIGSLQYLFYDIPFHSITYFLCGIVGHGFLLEEDRLKFVQLQQEKQLVENELKIAEQTIIANTDKMTGCNNRRAYEAEMAMLAENGLPDNFIYVSADVNGLKVVNDTLGHAAGDELLKGAVDCLEKAMGRYGKIFRLGGDEFAAIIYAKENELPGIKNELEMLMYTWSGEQVKSLAISVGYVSIRENPAMTLAEMEKLADQRMYQNKQEYYANKGIDRRGQQIAYNALCASYQKILKIDLTNDKYRIISMDEGEHTTEYGFSDKISEWFMGFCKTGNIHPEDIAKYTRHTDINNLRSCFSSGRNIVGIFYRRKMLSSEGWHRVMMEIMRAEDYRDDNQSIYLFVKELDR